MVRYGVNDKFFPFKPIFSSTVLGVSCWEGPPCRPLIERLHTRIHFIQKGQNGGEVPNWQDARRGDFWQSEVCKEHRNRRGGCHQGARQRKDSKAKHGCSGMMLGLGYN